MGKKSRTGNRRPVGKTDFLETLSKKAGEGDWKHVLLMTTMALKENYEAKGWQISHDELENLWLGSQCLTMMYNMSSERQS